tara:strand:+ start:513 stop:989 length:477 start_codon:yes stop_codon:yes gene_type:complete
MFEKMIGIEDGMSTIKNGMITIENYVPEITNGQAAIGVVMMYFVSGLFKLFSNTARAFDVKRMTKLFPPKFSLILVVLAGVLEVIAAGVVGWDIYFDVKTEGKLSPISRYAILALILFTFLATLFLYIYPTPRWRAILSNIATTSALMLLYNITKKSD